MTISETLDEWAKDYEGFVDVPGRGWVNVKETAKKYAADSRRDTYERPEWESSAGRFIAAVNAADSWCEDPSANEVFENCVPPHVALFDQHRIERRRSA